MAVILDLGHETRLFIIRYCIPDGCCPTADDRSCGDRSFSKDAAA
jgi:hypothetical protein